MSALETIATPHGTKLVGRVVGDFVWTLPVPNAPHGEWWRLSPGRGYTPIGSNCRALLRALESLVA